MSSLPDRNTVVAPTKTDIFLKAAKDGDLGVFEELSLTEDIHLHKDEYGSTLIIIAASYGHREIVQLLLTKYPNKVDINAENNFHHTPLWYAARYGHKDVVETMLQYTNTIKPPVYESAISVAIARERLGIVELLLGNNDIDSSARNTYGSDAMIYATKSGNYRIVEYLMGRGDINLSQAACHEALIEGTIEGHIKAVELLLQRNDIDINAVDRKKRSLLIEAARHGPAGIMQKLLARDDINVNIRSKKQTALEAALERGRQDIVELLFARNDLDLTKFSVDESISQARKSCHFELVQVLLAWACSKFPSRTPISWSAEHGQTDVLSDLLLSEDGDTRLIANSKDPGGRTPLSLAAENGHVNTVSVLIEKDADANLQDSDGRTPLWWAVENGHEGVVEVLTPYDTTTLLLLTQQGKQAAAIKLMPHNGLRLDQKDGQGRTVLHLAALLGYYDIARHLLLLSEAGKIINSKDHTGETPLRLAIGGKHKSIVQELLNHKADTKDIEAKEWRQAYNNPEYDTVMLSKKREGGQSLDFPATFLSREDLSKTSTAFTSRL
ncbi:hypothetical protein THAR02_02916 [Trichoderma harzianum]|uniref:Uncharacterized protein n=1 Tax=Trichoderma harzianum TaxID=5544 RepID=A0A0G0AJC8_TRIHA|nr:hypothetical protein THAR02_02916 [Trichoderma harzianum]